MRKNKSLVAGFCFFAVSVMLIANIHSLREFFPSQEVPLSHGASFSMLLKDYLFVQEVTLKKRFVNRIDVFLAKVPNTGPSENVFVLLDAGYRILYTKKILSGEIDGPCFYPIDFKKSIDIGKGKKIFACLNSIDGTSNSSLALPRKVTSGLGKFYVIPVQNNDVISTLEKQQGAIPFEGSMGLRTWESDTRFFTSLQILLYLLAFLFTLLIVFFRKIQPFLLKSNPSPEIAFCSVALVFGFLMVFINPPFQVPDEPQHLYRSYQVAELNIFKFHDSIPQSLVTLASISDRMKFMAHEKTSKKEILELSGIKLDPTVKTSMESPNYIVPYLPQAFGIMTGKLFHLEPLWLFYLGRIFNLLVSVVLLFIAIRTTPVLKWLFFSLSILPMTLYEMSSLSYDALTISLSFLLIAIILNFALNEAKVIRTRDILVLFLIAVLLASSKPPYYIIAFSFLIIPVKKFGSWKKFLLVFAGLAAIVIIVSQLYSPSRQFFEKFHSADKPITVTSMVAPTVKMLSGEPQPSPLPQQPVKKQDKPAASTQAEAQTTQNPPANPAQPAANNLINPSGQKKFILEDPIRYIGIIFDTFGKFIGLYQISFIGLFGWVDTPLPSGIIYPYLILLILIALSFPTRGIRIGLLKKCVLFALFLIGFILVETAMYVYCNPVGYNTINAVQGRYFVAFGPLIFIIFYNHFIAGFANRSLDHSPKLTEKEKRNQRKKSSVKVPVTGQMYTQSLPWFVMGFGVFVLIYSLYLILSRFYIIII